jgi:hypothetical protein
MSKIPYHFDTPVPRYFKIHGWLKNPKSRAFISWCFERCSNIENDIVHDGRRIILKPYQFIFGRKVCSEETGLTDREIRTQQECMETSGFLKKSTNKTPNRFTVYEWVTAVFCVIDDQQNDHVETNKRPTSDHNKEQENKRTKEQQEQNNARPVHSPLPVLEVPSPVCSVFAVSSAEAVFVNSATSYACLVRYGLNEKDQKFFLNFPENEVIRAVHLMQNSKKEIKNVSGYLRTALEKNWMPKKNDNSFSENTNPITLSVKAEELREKCFQMKDRLRDELKNKDILFQDMLDHVLFGHIKIFYENKDFNREMGLALAHFNLLHLINKKFKPLEISLNGNGNGIGFKKLDELALNFKESNNL